MSILLFCHFRVTQSVAYLWGIEIIAGQFSLIWYKLSVAYLWGIEISSSNLNFADYSDSL